MNGSMNKKRFFILIPLFHDGGVEQWVKGLIAGFDDYEVYLFVHGEIINEIPLEKSQIYQINKFWEIVKVLKSLKFGRNDTIFSSLTPSNIRGVFLKIYFGCQLITGVQVSLMKLPWESWMKYKIRKRLYRIFHFFSDFTIVASSGIQSEIDPSCKSRKIKVFWNPVINLDFLRTPKPPINKRSNIILGVGRLERQKGFDRLLRAGKLLLDRGVSDFQLRIVGDGSLKNELVWLTNDLGLKDHVEFLPFTSDVFKYYLEAKVFVLSSLYEGFGNVLAEALVSNCYCISYDINHGPQDILNNGEFGVLVPDNDILSLSEEISKGLSFNKGFLVAPSVLKRHGMKFTSECYIEKLKDEIICKV